MGKKRGPKNPVTRVLSKDDILRHEALFSKPRHVIIDELIHAYPEITEERAEFFLNYAESKILRHKNRTECYREVYPKANEKSASLMSLHILKTLTGQAAMRSLLSENDVVFNQERSANFHLTKDKVVEDLELIKLKALDKIDEGQGSGGAYQGFVKATELQGKAVGMFIQKHHHEHEHSVVPSDRLIEELAKTNPSLADSLGRHLGVIDGEFEEA